MLIIIIKSIIIGVASTIFMDVATKLRELLFQIKPLNYALVGRWFLSWKSRTFLHKNITQSPVKKFEVFFGWFIHYLVGIFWAYLYLILNDFYSFEKIFISILIFVLLSTLVPFLIMQPALGFGFFALNTTSPLKSIKNSIISHTFFGIGLYLSYQFFILY